MEFTLNLVPNQNAIFFVDETMKNYTNIFNLPSKKELCFIVHELVINAVEAMEFSSNSDTEKIQVTVSQDSDLVKVTVVDHGKGIPKDSWEDALKFNLDEIGFSDRGRGLFFVKNMVDEVWFENVSESKFLVGVSKRIGMCPEVLG